MKIFVSGATGFIGSRLIRELSSRGNTIHALYRDEEKAERIKDSNIRLFKGDILSKESIMKAVEGCDQIYHVAAFAKVWTKEHSKIYRLNIEGAMNVIHSGIQAGVKKMVITSTAGVFGPSNNKKVDEKVRPDEFFIDYESSKYLLERAIDAICAEGSNIVVVNPTRVFGPGLLNDGNSVTKMIYGYYRGSWRMIPGNGKGVGNYVFVDDVIQGHILAMEKGRPGERYILGGDDISYNDFFRILGDHTGRKRIMLKIPLFLILFLSRIMIALARMTGSNPMITPGLVKKFYHDFRVSSRKSIDELGYEPVSIEDGIRKTLDWLNAYKRIK